MFLYLLLDCCLPSYDGDKDFKGRYTFPETLVNRTNKAQCKYNPAELSRRCISDMEIGPFWGNTNLDNCDARYTTTNNLLKLNQVHFLFIFFPMQTFAVYWPVSVRLGG